MRAEPPRPGAAALFEAGWYRHALRRDSPHFDPRPAGSAIELIVLHGISLPEGEFGAGHVDALFMGRLDPGAHADFETLRGLRVSSHFFIRRDGKLAQYVSCEQRAWHAGVSSLWGRERCNDYSVGIELEGCDAMAYAAPQYESLGALLGALLEAYPVRAIAGHSDIAPGRKTDPGPHFDWDFVRRASALPDAALPPFA
ncbi:1,6-anhydro-N-acetylmuramyl-L-alanine amidase AmpD [Thiomonas sp.]|jgi:AmpD protein|uniref:1,6-anhydro-N-acetylmuramyl-L-alanine amidase AmpD n=1 Tax=Thiomonas sp. TaxID=2047785 RepID=UPI00261AC252|nr:1,6-anhydro-N-acetylmuramyl-L-alanine amidase AmpD [Thiomonas sp.]